MGTEDGASSLLEITMGELALLLANSLEESPEPGEGQYSTKASSPKQKEESREALSEETLAGELGEPCPPCKALGGAASLMMIGGRAGSLTLTLLGRQAGMAEELALAEYELGVVAALVDSDVETEGAEELAPAEYELGVVAPLVDSDIGTNGVE